MLSEEPRTKRSVLGNCASNAAANEQIGTGGRVQERKGENELAQEGKGGRGD